LGALTLIFASGAVIIGGLASQSLFLVVLAVAAGRLPGPVRQWW
jgi:hypothetical protein